MSVQTYAMAMLWCSRRLGQSVLMLVLFWVAVDLIQSHVLMKPTTALMMTQQTINPREYGYFSHAKIEKAPVVKRLVKRKRPIKVVPRIEVQVYDFYCDARGPDCPRPRRLS